MDEQVVPQLNSNSNQKDNQVLIVPNNELDPTLEDQRQLDINSELINNNNYESDDNIDDVDIALVLKFLIIDNQLNINFEYSDINQLTELYPFEEQPIRQNPRSRNLLFEDFRSISSLINLHSIIERMDILETFIYYIIFEQRI
tara:strand:- start:837 stop:1268 length:432 start_codon:yes stop_codon:yes gene_type:complete